MDSGAVLTLGQWSATNSDNYIVNGGLLNASPSSADANYFTSHHHDRRHDRRRLRWSPASTQGVNVNATPGGSLISSNFVWSARAAQ